MQILCIETSTIDAKATHRMIKGEMYNSIRIEPIRCIMRGVDMWHRLQETPPNHAHHVSLFIELPNQEGVVFSKKEELVEI